MQLGRPLLDALNRMGDGGLVLDADGQVLMSNDVAEKHLQHHTLPSRSDTPAVWARNALKALLRQAESRFAVGKDSWALLKREGRRPLILHAVPVADGAESGPHTVVILIDLDEVPRPKSPVLQNLFGLTATEARLAIELGCGKSPEEIANLTNVTVGTVRKQLASVFMKTNTHRQAELVALLSRVAILP